MEYSTSRPRQSGGVSFGDPNSVSLLPVSSLLLRSLQTSSHTLLRTQILTSPKVKTPTTVASFYLFSFIIQIYPYNIMKVFSMVTLAALLQMANAFAPTAFAPRASKTAAFLIGTYDEKWTVHGAPPWTQFTDSGSLLFSFLNDRSFGRSRFGPTHARCGSSVYFGMRRRRMQHGHRIQDRIRRCLAHARRFAKPW